MDKTVLFAGTGPLRSMLIEEYLKKGYKVISSVFDIRKTEPGQNIENSRHLVLPWTPGSSLSPRNIIMKAQEEMGSVKEAFLIFPSGRSGESLHEISSAGIQKIIDYRVKSYLFFFKELLNLFIRNKEGELNAVLYSEEGEWQSPLNAGTYEMFYSVIKSAFTIYEREPFTITGFESDSKDLNEFGSFILSKLEKENSEKNRFYRFPERNPLLNLGSGIIRKR